MDYMKELENFTSCDISDALLKLRIPHGGFIPDIDMLSPSYKHSETRIIGPAFLVKMVEKESNEPRPSEHFCDVVPEGHVLVLSAPKEAKNAVMGGLLAARAKFRGARGVVVDGRVRDLVELRSSKFPVFARATSTLSAGPFTRPTTLNQSLSIGEVKINPGDIIIADADGVVCLPLHLVKDVINECKKSVEVDEKCMRDIIEGRGIAETFAEHRGK
ncbi:uncharacterized protein VTP21DRAFT_8333 [Calcarisporiella thermophila]|uniref:uncharacterized protein n=1 Tax=Calcarisporiella thermophila TaxID=911321 RepID=UPI0037448D3A